MDVSQSDLWLLWGFVGLLILAPVALYAITRPMERKLDRIQSRSATGRRWRLATALVIAGLMVTSAYLGSHFAQGAFDRTYDSMRQP